MAEHIARLSITDAPLAIVQVTIHFYFHGDLHLVVAVCVIPLETQKNQGVNPLYGGCFSDEHSSEVASLFSLIPVRIPYSIPDAKITG